MGNKDLILVRALPGAGKTTLANLIAVNSNVAADDFFDRYCDGKFDAARLPEAHGYCQGMCDKMMQAGCERIAVHNTFTQEWEMIPYQDMAKKYGYRVFHIIVENRHGGESVHNVPEATIEKMRNRFEVKL